MIEDILNKLLAANLGFTTNNLFIGELPLNNREVVAMLYAISPEPNKVFDVFEQHIDFWSRYQKSTDAYNKLLAIEQVFRNKNAYDLSHIHVYFSHSLGRVEDMGRSVDELKMYKLSMRFLYRNKE